MHGSSSKICNMCSVFSREASCFFVVNPVVAGNSNIFSNCSQRRLLWSLHQCHATNVVLRRFFSRSQKWFPYLPQSHVREHTLRDHCVCRNFGKRFRSVNESICCRASNNSDSSSSESSENGLRLEGDGAPKRTEPVFFPVEGPAFSNLQRRRFFLGISVGILALLGGNFLGITSLLLNFNPKFARRVRADVLFPVKGFKRCFEPSRGFEFIYPSTWVGDQRLLYRAIKRAEREQSIDLPALQEKKASKRVSTEPSVAFGPPGTDGELNVSVVVAPVLPGLTLQKLGNPAKAGNLILKNFVAPEGSNRVATLLSAQQRGDEESSGRSLYYTLEFSVKGPTFERHNIAVYAVNEGQLYSINAQAPEKIWKEVKSYLTEIANSFTIVV